MYDVGEEDSDAATDQSQISLMGQSSPMQLPVVEVMKVFASCPCSLAHPTTTSIALLAFHVLLL